MRRSGRRWRSRSRPISTRKARSSAGVIRSGATAIPRGPGARRSRRCSRRPNSQILFRARSPPIRRRPMAAAPTATRFRCMTFRPGQIECHRLLTMPIRTSALRTLGAQGNVFAIESFLDELAAERGEDPVAFRLRHLRDERAKDVIRAVARRANWKPAKQSRHRLWHRLCPLQEHRRLLRRDRRDRGRRGYPRQAADASRSMSARPSIPTA